MDARKGGGRRGIAPLPAQPPPPMRSPCQQKLGRHNAMKPHKFPCTAPARESICACPRTNFFSQASVELRIDDRSYVSRLSPVVVLSIFGELLVARSRRCRRRVRIIHAPRAVVQGAHRALKPLSTRILRCPPRLTTIHRFCERFAARGRPDQPPRYAATTSRWVASSVPVPDSTIRPRSIT